MRGRFKEVGKLVKKRRLELDLNQDNISFVLGYKNGQSLSNIERGLCSVPKHKIKELASELKVEPEFIAWAMIADFSQHIMEKIK